MLGKILKSALSVGKVSLSAGYKAAGTEVGRTIIGGGLKMGIAYGAMQGANAAADFLENSNIPGLRVGGFWTGALRAVGTIGGVASMGSTAVRTAGKLTSISSRGLRGTLYKQMIAKGKGFDPTSQVFGFLEKSSDFGNKMQKASLGKSLFKLGIGGVGKNKTSGAKLIGSGAMHLGRGLAMSPVAVGADILGTLTGAGSNSVSRGLYSVGNKFMGARMFGWGAALGAGKLFAETSGTIQGYNIDEANQSLGARSLSLAGQQIYNPIDGRGPSRMNPNATAGLTQSLHRLR